jgi:hypothetical protein
LFRDNREPPYPLHRRDSRLGRWGRRDLRPARRRCSTLHTLPAHTRYVRTTERLTWRAEPARWRMGPLATARDLGFGCPRRSNIQGLFPLASGDRTTSRAAAAGRAKAAQEGVSRSRPYVILSRVGSAESAVFRAVGSAESTALGEVSDDALGELVVRWRSDRHDRARMGDIGRAKGVSHGPHAGTPPSRPRG